MNNREHFVKKGDGVPSEVLKSGPKSERGDEIPITLKNAFRPLPASNF